MPEPTLVEKWRDRLAKGESANKKWRETFRIDDLDKYWEGNQKPDWWVEKFFMPINLIFSNIQSQMDSLKAATPRYNVRPARTYSSMPGASEQLDAQASVREALLNYTVREKAVKRECAKALLDAYVAFGVVKTFYTPYHIENPKKGRVIDGAMEPDVLLIAESFNVSRRNPSDIRFDPYADSLENIKWVAERIEFTVEEVKNNKLFKNTEDIKAYEARVEEKEEERKRKQGDMTSTPMTGGNSSISATSLRGDREKIIQVWEIYDIENGRLICIAEGHDKELRDDPMPDGIEDHPYVFLWFIDRRNSPYPIPDIWNQVGPQDEYNVTRNQIMLHRRRFNRKYTRQKGMIDNDEAAKLEDPYDGIIIEVKGAGDIIRPIKDAPLDQAVYFDTQMLRNDFMTVAGENVPDAEIAKIEKASVANLISNQQERRKRGKLAVMQDFYNSIARKLMLLYEQEMTIPTAIAISGVEGQMWKQIEPGDLTGGFGEFQYEVDTSSLTPINPEMERASWVGFMQFVQMNPILMSNPILVKKTSKMFGVEDKIIVDEVVKTAQAIQQQQMLQGGQAGQPSMSPDMSKALGVGQ